MGSMIPSLNRADLEMYVGKQLYYFFPDKSVADFTGFVDAAMERTEHCFSQIGGKYFSDGEATLFNHLNSDQYAMFLYFLSNTIWKLEGDPDLASKVYYLNKALHSLDVFYEVALPDIFRLLHPVGTVLGRGTYSNYFVAYHGCTVGTDLSYDHPVIGEGVAMLPNSAILGNSKIGDNCWVSIGATIMDNEFAPGQVLFGQHNVGHKRSTSSVIEHYFKGVMKHG